MKKKFYKNPVLALLLTCTLTAGNLTFPVLAEDPSPGEAPSAENISENKPPPEAETVLFTENVSENKPSPETDAVPFAETLSPTATSLSLNENVTLEYNTEETMRQELYDKLIQALNTNESEPVPYTIDDFSFEFIRETGGQHVTVTYIGNETYAPCTAQTIITITERPEQEPEADAAKDSGKTTEKEPETDAAKDSDKTTEEEPDTDTAKDSGKTTEEELETDAAKDSGKTTAEESEENSADNAGIYWDQPFTGNSRNPLEGISDKESASVIINSQNITYGETFAPVFSSEPADAKVFGIIAGIDRHGDTYLSIDASSITLNDITGTTLPENGGQSLQDYILEHAGSTFTLRDLSAILDSIAQLPGSNAGEAITGIQQAIAYAGQIDERLLDTPIIVGGLPTEPGIYTAVGVTVNPKYQTAIGMGTLTITSRVSNVTLAFDQEFDNDAHFLPYEQMYDFRFGGHLVEDDPQAAEKICTLYVGTSFDGEFHTETSPILKPGIYTETIYLSDENYFAVPISRIYTIQRQKVEIRFDSQLVTVRYDGTPHGVTAGVYAGNERIAEARVTYIGFRNGEPVSFDTEQPADVGVYLATAVYLGDAMHQPAINIEGSLIILGADPIISIYPVEPISLNKTGPLQYIGSTGTASADTGDSTSPAGNAAGMILSAFAIAAVLFRRHRMKH